MNAQQLLLLVLPALRLFKTFYAFFTLSTPILSYSPLLSEEELYDINIPLNLTVGKSSRHSTAAV